MSVRSSFAAMRGIFFPAGRTGVPPLIASVEAEERAGAVVMKFLSRGLFDVGQMPRCVRFV
jgi:hypothetical protein